MTRVNQSGMPIRGMPGTRRRAGDAGEPEGLMAMVSRWIAAGIVVIGMAVVTALWMPAPASAQTAPQSDIPLKLFERSEVDLVADCGTALWQASRDPLRDRFAVVFSEPMGQAEARARIKVGQDVVPLMRVAAGGATFGRGLSQYMLYKMPETGDYVVLDLVLGAGAGDAVSVVGGTMAVIMRGRPVFRVSVAGRAGCPSAPSADGVGIVPARQG